MNFPDVPIDENLLESNEMMMTYWNRSTDGRSFSFVNDSAEAKNDDVQELMDLSRSAVTENLAVPVKDDVPDVVVPNIERRKASKDALVEPKSLSVSTSQWIAIAIIAALLVLAVMTHKKYGSSAYRR